MKVPNKSNNALNSEPSQSSRPLLSILICNYNGKLLGRCLESILNQEIFTDHEIVLIDDASHDGTWDTALEFLRHHGDRITYQRNRVPHGPMENFRKALAMAKGAYYTTMQGDESFQPEYIRRCVEIMEKDYHSAFDHVYRIDEDFQYRYRKTPSITGQPLVSILCYNYNYGRFLEQCLESVFAQTYKNIELCFSDNASTDESWEIAVEFARRYPHQVYLARNRSNFGTDSNFANCLRNMQGKYYINFCSDDVLCPEYVARCVEVLESRPHVGMAIVHRAIIDEEGRRTEEPPFYNRSCIIPGKAQAAVYMMAGVNPSVSQIMYRSEIVFKRAVTGSLVARYYGTRILDFNISLDYDVAYLKEPLLLHRVHAESDTRAAESNLLPVLGWYVLNHQLAELAAIRKVDEAARRLPESIEKLAHLAIRYAVRALMDSEEGTARRYFHLAAAMTQEICRDERWKQLESYWSASPHTREEILEGFRRTANLATRTISYDPPPGSLPLEGEAKERSPLPRFGHPEARHMFTPPSAQTGPDERGRRDRSLTG